MGSRSRRIRRGWQLIPSNALVSFFSAMILAVPMAAGFHAKQFVASSSSMKFPNSVRLSPAPESNTEEFRQDYRSFFQPAKRPLRLRSESQPERGFWLFEQPLHVLPMLEVDVRMAVYTLMTGSILVYNPFAPTEETLEEFNDTFGEPDHIILSTTTYHHLENASGWIKRFPRATVWTLEGVEFPEARFRRDITLESLPEEWLDELDFCVFHWNPFIRELYVLHRTTKIVFAMDSFVELQKAHISNPLLRLALKTMGVFGQPVCPFRPLVWNRETCRETASELLEWDFHAVCPTHGTCPVHDGKNAMRNALNFLWVDASNQEGGESIMGQPGK